MTRTPQSVELLTLDEIRAIKQQLIETTKLLADAEKLAEEKDLDGLNVLYKTGLLRMEASLRRLHSSLYQSISKTRLGQDVSISARAKRRITEAAKELRAAKGTAKKGRK
jgi:chaperonin cofactor prefoldin